VGVGWGSHKNLVRPSPAFLAFCRPTTKKQKHTHTHRHTGGHGHVQMSLRYQTNFSYIINNQCNEDAAEGEFERTTKVSMVSQSETEILRNKIYYYVLLPF